MRSLHGGGGSREPGLAFLFAAALAAAPLAARPEGIGVLAVAPTPGPTPHLVELTGRLRQLLAERAPGILEPEHLRARMAGQAGGSALTATDRAYSAAAASGDPRRAIEGLNAVIRELESFPDSEETLRQWTRATLRLAQLESQLEGHEEQARSTVERLLRVAPFTPVRRDTHGPVLVDQFEAAKQRLAGLPRYYLRVSSGLRTGARIYVSGREAGTTPATLTLARGRYRITGSHGPLRSMPVEVELQDKGKAVELDFGVAETLRPAQGPGLAVEPRDHLKIIDAGRLLRLDTVVAVQLLEEAGVTYLLAVAYDTRAGAAKLDGIVRLRKGAPSPRAMEALAELLLTPDAARGLSPRALP